MTPLSPGTPAPDFTLPSTMDRPISLAEYRGRPVVLAFFPATWSPVCEEELALFQEVLPELHELGAELLGISVDNIWSQLAWANEYHFQFPLLSDFHPRGQVARHYGVLREDGVTERALFVIDGEGKIRYCYVSPLRENPGADRVLKVLEDLRAEREAGAH